MHPYQQFQLNTYGNILCEDGFSKDIVPVNEELENRLTDDEKAMSWFINEHEKQLLNDERNFPQSQDQYNIFK